MASLELRQLVKDFETTRVIHGVDLEVGSGEFAVFVGPSGCGKSTLLRLICGLEEASSGDILIDEPLSNLDAELRVSMRGEISALHRRLGATMVYVTHDQVEAMTMADRIVVLRGGRIEQVGSPLTLYNQPANRFVAGFIGSPQMNFIAVSADADAALRPAFGGSVVLPGVAAAAGTPLVLGVRPEHLSLEPVPGALALPITVSQVEQLGGLSLVYGSLPADAGRLTVQAAGQVDTRVGATLTAYAPPAACHAFEEGESGRALGSS